MEPEQIAELQELIRKKANVKSEVFIYSLNNPYLSPAEKPEIEIWYHPLGT